MLMPGPGGRSISQPRLLNGEDISRAHTGSPRRSSRGPRTAESPENSPFPQPGGGRTEGPLSFAPLLGSVLSGIALSRLNLGSATYAQLVFGAQPVFNIVTISSTFGLEEGVSQHGDVFVFVFRRVQIVFRVVFVHVESFLVSDLLRVLFGGRCSGEMSLAECSCDAGLLGHSQLPDVHSYIDPIYRDATVGQ